MGEWFKTELALAQQEMAEAEKHDWSTFDWQRDCNAIHKGFHESRRTIERLPSNCTCQCARRFRCKSDSKGNRLAERAGGHSWYSNHPLLAQNTGCSGL